MALRESSVQLPRALRKAVVPSVHLQAPSSRRNASSSTPSATDNALNELEPDSSLAGSTRTGYEDKISAFDPIKQSRARKTQLPPSRYQYRSPKYYRGPLHPHQPPPESDPHSRLFVPGPFSLPRVEQTYESTIAPDILTLCYVHNPPGFKLPERAERLRKWEGDSPYFANRPRRGPRGGDVLRLLRKPITFRNIPKLERITVHSFVSDAVRDGSGPLHVAGMAIQAITNKRVETFKSKTSVPSWGIQPGKAYVSVKADLRGEDMHHFFGKLVDVVFPRIKDWKGIKKTSGDGSGNIAVGLDPEDVAHFPEIEVNYDMYPPQYLPGCDITIHTSATTDKDARLLLSAMGIPFAGRHLN